MYTFIMSKIRKKYIRKSGHTSQVVHQASAYPGFSSMNSVLVFLLPSGWDASLLQGYLLVLSTPRWSEAI